MKDQSKPTRDQNADVKEAVSAFMDSELSAEELDALLAKDASQWASSFDQLHSVNHAIHHENSPLVVDTQSFLAGMHDKMAMEEAAAGQSDNVVSMTTSRVSERVEHSTGRRKPTKLFGGVMFGGAIAASVAFAVVLGGNLLLNPNGGSEPSVDQVANTFEADTQIAPIESLKDDSALANNERLQEYLKRHAEQSALTSGQGMMPMARVVSYPTETSEQEK
ncbi:hypothetical protein [Marinomonas mediterranea]|jgi:Anti sigma-E protein RseA, N-terminal domain.|uniref:Anti sigma-E protein RseA family protein n=1 Tax=Marinomonas mediterranea (strain ATCC 700492 / JCM 21426 / NBRC 103028 / MMB-1) TaxID=717774 RepID=F2K394_MARM1|nr:hypothetical protein [Marinomonas mediterranea]ADZ90147.1 hypothetical protein Marme_0872 [Marinomonas mediterranea MMB-1]WCN08211.1 hypothetical protein GV055_04410 [Marinomonas mediterranea]WCN12278.1 hypothetical protein GV054_04310 [Marinomonas mediterranea]WCN16351.1 hypothetical protein GV053_04415 [Marinomonas mediterranea MMB-1]